MQNHSGDIAVVTGATGHIGNVLVRMLLSLKQRVRVLVLPGENLISIQDLPIEIVEGDILDPCSISRAIYGATHVYHLAGLISILPGDNFLVRRVNVDGTRNIIRLSHQANVRRLVYASSIHALSRLPHGCTIDESVPFDVDHAIGVYDRSKAEASLLVQDAANLGLDAVIVCPTGVIGPFDFRRSEMGSLILDSINTKPCFCVEGTYDFVDVRDVADGLIKACHKGQSGESYILSGEQIELKKIMQLARASVGIKGKIYQVPFILARLAAVFSPLYYRLARQKPRLTRYSLETVKSNSKICCEKARRELGYTPRPLRSTIVDTVDWFLKNKSRLVSGDLPTLAK